MPSDEEGENRPRRKRRAEDHDPQRRYRDEEEGGEDDRPRRRRRDEEAAEDEDEDRPRRRRRYEDDENDYIPRRGRRLPRETLREIALYQKALIAFIIVYLCLIGSQYLLREEDRIYLLISVVPILLSAALLVFLLLTKVANSGLGVALAVLTLVPCVGLIVLVVANIKATSALNENGIRVGFFGASLSDI